MRDNSFRTRLATSAFTLPVMAGLTVLLWMLPAVGDLSLWMGLVFVGLTTFLLEELNTRHSLIRVRSRMMGASFLAFLTAGPAFHAWSTTMIPMMCLVLSYFQLFRTYQKARPEGHVFAGFLCLGIAGWFYPLLLLCAVIFYIGLLIPLRSLTWRTCFAGLFGLLLPFWFQAGWAVWHEEIDTVFIPFVETFHLVPPDYSAIPTGVLAWFALLLLVAACATVHFSHTAYNDKIRTRMYFYVIIWVELFLFVALFLKPQSYPTIGGLLVANSSPLIAHYFTLGKSRVLNYWFIVCLCLLGLLTIFNLFDLWTLLSNF